MILLRRAGVSALALGWSTLALAGEEPLYQPAPDWVVPVDQAAIERDPANVLVVSDNQVRITEGLHWDYREAILRVTGLSDLSEIGTLNLQWRPDKGDLMIHRIALLRDGEEIDLVSAGERLEVLRREERLEEQVLDGALTATLSVPDLRVGDELRIAYSVTTSDQVLGNEVQSQTYLWRKPDVDADFARVMVSWPDDLDVNYNAGPGFELAPAQSRSGYRWIEVSLPLPEAEELPEDAPLRYRRETLLQVGTFADWAEVSSVLAPYYEVTGALAGLDDLAARIDDIRTSHDNDLERAVAALELVQEDVRYLMNGLDGGNYRPQDVATTWDKKYGDCKAKTVLLLAALDRLGIEAEAVLVSTERGNALPISLPLPGAFDHVLVRATIDGQLYYLDGTSIGANIALVGNVPAYEYALPIRAQGAELEQLVQVLPREPEMIVSLIADASAGVDLPVLATLELELLGPEAAQLNANAPKLTEDRKRQMGRTMNSDLSLIDVEISAGDDDSEAIMVITGIMPPLFDYDGTRGEFDPTLNSVTFSPNRSRRAWRELPVAIGAASATALNLRAQLPDGVAGFELRGAQSLDEEVAGRRVVRTASLADGRLALSELIVSRGGEIAAAQVPDERRKAASFARNEVKVIAPEGAPRRWRFARSEDRTALAALEAAYARMIENDPEEADPYLSRASFRYDTFDFAGSLADMDKVIELSGTAEYHSQRATVHMALSDLEAARDDLEEAYLLEPTPWRAINYADVLFHLGDAAAARDLLLLEDGDKEVRQSLAYELADYDAFEGRPQEGLARIDEVLADDPNNISLLNGKCWYMGIWQVELQEALEVCRRAVEIGGDADVLDSRAMVFYRNGMFEEALKDLDEALELNPEQTGSLLLRGVIRREQGDRAGQADIDEALARNAMLGVRYRIWGFDI
jgi:tetratricopeptide (TPR) repeat protein